MYKCVCIISQISTILVAPNTKREINSKIYRYTGGGRSYGNSPTHCPNSSVINRFAMWFNFH